MKLRFTAALSLFIWLSTAITAFGQLKIPDCPLDSADFTTNTQRKLWVRDTQQVSQVENRINYLANLHRNFLPKKFPLKRRIKAMLNSHEPTVLHALDSLYLHEMLGVRDRYLGKTPGFNDNLPVFTRLNFVITFEAFELYPDLYPILLNPIHPFKSTDVIQNIIDDLNASTSSRFKKEFIDEFHQFL